MMLLGSRVNVCVCVCVCVRKIEREREGREIEWGGERETEKHERIQPCAKCPGRARPPPVIIKNKETFYTTYKQYTFIR